MLSTTTSASNSIPVVVPSQNLPSPSSSTSSTQLSSEKIGGGDKHLDSGTSKLARSRFSHLPAEKEERLRQLYKQFDVNKDGTVDIKDLTIALGRHMPNIPESREYAKRIIDIAHKGDEQEIDFGEFVHYILEHEKNLAITFRELDRNADGTIDYKDVKNYFHRLGMVDVTDSEAKEIIKKMDRNDTKWISLEEFQRYFLLHPSSSALDIARYWRRNLYFDIGEEIVVPPEYVDRQAWLRHLLAGGVAGAVSRTFTAPLDRLKVFLQVHASRNNGYRVVTSLRFLIREGGLVALWRGNGVNVLKIIPESAIKFAVYEQAKQLIKRNRNHSGELTGLERFFAGTIAGAASQTSIYPLEVLKTRLALRRTGEMNRGLLDAFFTIHRNEGIRVFWRGYCPSLLGIIPYAGTDLAVYETLKRMYLRRNPDNNNDPGVLVLLGCGVCSSACGQLVSYPLSLVRTRLQAHALQVAATRPDTMVGQFSHIWRQEGVTGLYRGLTPNFMKVLPAVSISYVVYETLRKHLGVEMT